MTTDAIKNGRPHEEGSTSTRATAHDRLQALLSVGMTIVRSLDLDVTMLSITNAARDLLQADTVSIMTVEGDVLKTQYCADYRSIVAPRFTARRGEGVAGTIFATGRSHGVPDFHDTTLLTDELKASAEQEGIVCALGAPMISDGSVTGVVMAWSHRAFAFDDGDREVLDGLANLAVIAINNARLYETAQHAVAELESSKNQAEEHCRLLETAAAAQTELTQLVLRGDGLSTLVTTIARYVDADVALLGSDLEPLAMTASGADLATWARNNIHARRTPPAPGRSTGDDVVHHDRALIRPVTSEGVLMAYLCLGQPHRAADFTSLLVEQAAVACALELTKQRAILDARIRVRGDFLWDLLEGRVADAAEANVRARYLGFTLPRQCRVLLAGIVGLDEWARENGVDADVVDQRRSAALARLERLATDTGHAPALTARRASDLALLVPGLPELAEARDLAAHLAHAIEATPAADQPFRFRVGISECVELTGDLSAALAQASTALTAATSAPTPAALFDDLGVTRFLLAPGDNTDLRALVDDVLGTLITYDRDRSTDLLDTLEAYLQADCSLNRTAEALRVHPKTVRYRLDRVRDLTGRSLASQMDCFDIQLALTVMRTLGPEATRTAR